MEKNEKLAARFERAAEHYFDIGKSNGFIGFCVVAAACAAPFSGYLAVMALIAPTAYSAPGVALRGAAHLLRQRHPN